MRKIQNWFGRLSPAWRVSLLTFLAGRLVFSLWAAVIWKMGLMPTTQGVYYFEITPILAGWPGALLGMWQRWDSIHYERILRFGYFNTSLTAFFPLYPLLSRLVASIPGVSPVAALLIVSNISFLLSLWLLYKIVSALFSEKLARRTLFCLIIYPSAVFFYAAYPQSLLFFLILLAFYFSLDNKWTAVAVVGFFAGLTHLTAILLPVLLFLPAYSASQNRPLKDRILILLTSFTSLAGIGVFFLWREMAGFGSYEQMQDQIFIRKIHLPWEGVTATIRYIQSLSLGLDNVIAWIAVVILFILVGLTLWSIKKLPLSFLFFEISVLILILCTYFDLDPLLGILRYPMVIFPFYIGLASAGQAKGWRILTFTLSVLASLICGAFFFMWKGGMS